MRIGRRELNKYAHILLERRALARCPCPRKLEAPAKDHAGMSKDVSPRKRRKVSSPTLGMRLGHGRNKGAAGKDREGASKETAAGGPQHRLAGLTGSAHACTTCQKVFNSPGKLQQHMYVHTGERPFACRECEKGFSSRFKLMRHSLIHSNERRYKCNYCERCFHRKDHLKNHLQVHNPDKKVYRCEQCAKEYNSRLSFRKHVAVHAAEAGDLECKVCGRTFPATPDVVYHLKVHAGSRAVKSPHDKKFQCDFCERRFFTRKDVKRHLVVHTGRRDFLCQFCPQRFGRKDHLVRHIKKSHSGMIGNVVASLPVSRSDDDGGGGGGGDRETVCPCDDDLGGDGRDSDYTPFNDYLPPPTDVHCHDMTTSDLLLLSPSPQEHQQTQLPIHHKHHHHLHHQQHHQQQEQHSSLLSSLQENVHRHHQSPPSEHLHHQSHLRPHLEEQVDSVYSQLQRACIDAGQLHASSPVKDDRGKSSMFSVSSPAPPLPPSSANVSLAAAVLTSSVPCAMSSPLTAVSSSGMYFQSHFAAAAASDAILQHEYKLFEEATALATCCKIKTEQVEHEEDCDSLEEHLNSTSLDISINQLFNFVSFPPSSHTMVGQHQHHHLHHPHLSHHFPLVTTAVGGATGSPLSSVSPSSFLATSTISGPIAGAGPAPVNGTPLPQFNQAFQ